MRAQLRTSVSAAAPGTLVAAALTAWRFDAKPMWRDEFYTYGTTNVAFTDMVGIVRGPDVGLAGYYTVMHMWMLVGDSTAWMRLPGALATVALVAATALLGCRLAGAWVGVLAGVLTALVPAVVTHAQEARAYPFVLLSCVVLAVLLLRDLDSPSMARRLLVLVVAVLPVVMHPLPGVPAVAGLFAAALLRPGAEHRGVLLILGAPAGVASALLVTAGFLVQTGTDPGGGSGLFGVAAFTRNLADAPLTAAVVVIAAVAGAISLARRDAPWVLMAGWAAAPVLVISALGLSGSFFQFRYVASAVPAVAVLAACGVVAVAGSARDKVRWLATAPVAVTVVVTYVLGAVQFRTDDYYADDPLGAAALLAADHRPGDAVVYSGRVARGLVQHYLADDVELEDPLLVETPERSGTLRGLTVPEDGRRAALAGWERVWIVGSEVGGRFTDTNEVDAARHGRQLVERREFGGIACELWVT
jgi:mannosyltransferase